jgi:hypothetical protein
LSACFLSSAPDHTLRFVVTTGAPGSTISPQYAAQQLLRLLGVRFFAWDETLVPTNSPLLLDGVDMTFLPQFEYRNIDGWAAMSNPQQAQYLHLNGVAQAAAATAATAGSRATTSPYASPPGFVHTSYTMLYDPGPTTGPYSNATGFPDNKNCSNGWANGCPPAELFRTRNEWFWPRDDGSAYGQLCWSNSSLVDHLAIKAAAFLSMQPQAKIISISQNDGNPPCQSAEELAIVKAEGSPMGPMCVRLHADYHTLSKR